MKSKKLFQKVISGTKNIHFNDVVKCAEFYGFVLDRINGSHHIFIHSNIPELLNLQNVKGKAKPYQIKQLLQPIERYDLKEENE